MRYFELFPPFLPTGLVSKTHQNCVYEKHLKTYISGRWLAHGQSLFGVSDALVELDGHIGALYLAYFFVEFGVDVVLGAGGWRGLGRGGRGEEDGAAEAEGGEVGAAVDAQLVGFGGGQGVGGAGAQLEFAGRGGGGGGGRCG